MRCCAMPIVKVLMHHAGRQKPAVERALRNWEVAMLTFIRSMTAAPGKFVQLAAFADEVDPVVSRVLGKKIKHGMMVGGQAGRMAWIIEYNSMAHLEEMTGKLLADPDYLALLQKGEGLSVAGSMHDDLVLFR
jgi:hypothetical protein